MTDCWPSVLDEMERRLAAAEAAMAAGDYRFDPVAIPASLGPLPATCRQRAEAIYVATMEMESHLSMAMAEIAGHLGRRPSAPESRPMPAYIDRRA